MTDKPQQLQVLLPRDDRGLRNVHAFHKAFGIDQPNSPGLPDEEVHEEVARFAASARTLAEALKALSVAAGGSVALVRLQLIQEELAEVADAMARGHVADVLAELVDLTYVVDGTYLAFGLGKLKGDAQALVHESNMTKLGADGKPVIGPSGRVEKGPNYVKHDVGRLF